MALDLRDQTFPFSVACDALGIQINTLRAWIKRKQVRFLDNELERADRNGNPHRVTYATVVRLAIMVKLTKFGMSPAAAWDAAFYFTSAGSKVTGTASTTRLAGELFKKGMTWLVVDEAGGAKVVNLHAEEKAANLGVYASEAIIIWMNPLVEHLNDQLLQVAEWSKAS
jgi:hypothetical protein